MASVTHNPMHLVQQVEQAIKREADRLREEMIVQKVSEFYSYERDGAELVIKVKYDSETPLR